MTEPSPDDIAQLAPKLAVDPKEKEKVEMPPLAPAAGTGEKDLSKFTDMASLRNYINELQREPLKRKMEAALAKQKKLENKDHKFWNTQPMLKEDNLKSEEIVNKPVNPIEDVEKVRAEPYNLPPGFVWCELDVNDETHITELYKLLSNNYVEDDDAMFRFDYSADFLRWALTVPEFRKDWHIGVRAEKSGKLMASITGVPAKVSVRGVQREMVEINFLCVHKKLREKRMAPGLIKEITRRVNLTGRWQAVYTAGVKIPTPIATTRYFHRNLQVKKLIDVSFSYLPRGKTMEDHVKSLDLPEEPTNALRPMEDKDVSEVAALLNSYLSSKCKVFQVFDEREIRHLLLPRPNVISSYVLEGQNGAITDFVSFYYLPSSIMKHETYKTLSAVYSYYNVATTASVEDLMRDALILAKKNGADVFNALNLMENGELFEKLQFGAGDGFLQYYLYNWECSIMEPKEVGIVLV